MIISDCNGEKMLKSINSNQRYCKIKVAQFILGQCVESCPLSLSPVQAQKSGRSCLGLPIWWRYSPLNM